jgi:16S rRNA (uracil1498-N3)-methyltransferase
MMLTESAARHVQVLRLQPNHSLTLFNGQGGEWQATILRITRQAVEIELLAHVTIERELSLQVTLAVVMPANDRMDDLVEKTTELGVEALQPLMSERSVLRLAGERAAKKVAHWQSVAQAACEQSGRNRVPTLYPVIPLTIWLQQTPMRPSATRWVLSTHPDCTTIGQQLAHPALSRLECLSGPEGGFSAAEVQAAIGAGFSPTSLGARILRADTAPLAAMSVLSFSSMNPEELISTARP